MPRRLLFIFTASLGMLSACQQAAWKMGANADDLKRDEQICRTQEQDDDAVKTCLRDKGWTVTDFSAPTDAIDDSVEPVATAPITASQVNGTEPKNAALNPADSAVNAQPTTMNTNKTTTSIAPATSTSTPASSVTAAATNTAEIKRAPANPLQQRSVQTWWKAGAQAADFNVDANACLAQLGEQHTPDYAKHLYTPALVSCLRSRGWYSGHDPVYTPLR